MKKIPFVLVGAGNRGWAYSNYIKSFPDEGEIAAVCEPVDADRDRFGEAFNIPQERRFRDWRDILDKPKLADAALICTQDAQHKDPAIALADKGYHLLLEKPMAPNAEDCKAICEAATRNGIILAVCHVLRYTEPNRKLKELINNGTIGKVHSIQQLEPVGYWHQAHSFVRGNWRNSVESSPMLLAKSCHDIDLLNYFMPSRCKAVSSFGSLSYFTPENKPAGAAARCVDCPAEVESKCAYSALKIYTRDRTDPTQWPVCVLTHEGTNESLMNALKNGPYGRCVFACDNDVVDHQVVNMEFEDNSTVSFTMTAFNTGGGREILIMGDQGMLRCTDDGIVHSDFLTDATNNIPLEMGDGQITSGHGGGDFGIMKDFLAAVRNNDPSLITSDQNVSLESHLIVFAAERSRLNKTIEEL